VYTGLTSAADEVGLRLFSLLAAWLALVGVYVLVRRAFTPFPAFLAVLATLAHPLVIEYALEARGYILWLASAVWYAYFLHDALTARKRVVSGTLLGITAVLLCTVHWFGILSLGLITAAELLLSGQPLRTWLRALLPVALGPIALLACLPLLMRQRAAFTVPTWIPTPTVGLVVEFLGGLLPLGVVVAALATFAVSRLLGRRDVPPASPRWAELRNLAGLLGLGALPLVVLVLSFVLQPSTLPKYALPTAVVFGPLIAWLFARATRPSAWVLAGLLVVIGAAEAWRLAAVRRAFDAQIDGLCATVHTHTDEAPVVIEDRGHLYAVCHYAPDMAPRTFGLYFEESRRGGLNPSLIHERELAVSFERVYGQPRLIHAAELRRSPRVFVLPIGDDVARLRGDYPGFQITRVTDQLYELRPETVAAGLERPKKRGQDP
jgi:hypothetical protein